MRTLFQNVRRTFRILKPSRSSFRVKVGTSTEFCRFLLLPWVLKYVSSFEHLWTILCSKVDMQKSKVDIATFFRNVQHTFRCSDPLSSLKKMQMELRYKFSSDLNIEELKKFCKARGTHDWAWWLAPWNEVSVAKSREHITVARSPGFFYMRWSLTVSFSLSRFATLFEKKMDQRKKFQ